MNYGPTAPIVKRREATREKVLGQRRGHEGVINLAPFSRVLKKRR
jgi:hypothetical protein